MPLYLVETYVPRGGSETLLQLEHRARMGTRHSRKNGVAVRLVRSLFVPEDETWFGLYEAPDRNGVERASSLAGIAFERVVEAVDAAHARREDVRRRSDARAPGTAASAIPATTPPTAS